MTWLKEAADNPLGHFQISVVILCIYCLSDTVLLVFPYGFLPNAVLLSPVVEGVPEVEENRRLVFPTPAHSVY